MVMPDLRSRWAVCGKGKPNLIEKLGLLCKWHVYMKDVVGASKTMKIIERGIEYNHRLKRKFSTISDNDSDDSIEISSEKLPLSSSSSSSTTYEAERAFVNNFKKNRTGKMSWKQLLSEGHAQGLFKNFSNKDSLRNHF
ncbi:predicted protein [Lichtheimia corymbifera JMRC:FSU:9682]|uniref:Uncharacterized protein n=1 Tax=Lichtheimia corymbifera JMRC:FSU:9682 TaxID=1263082 RepID=A0A068SB43_9FUNG|nr:predicted protein [Lichtheimia corymbifera JMRC:FSU:9682]